MVDWVEIPIPCATRDEVSARVVVSEYPVTVAQFKQFLNEDGYHRRELWSSEGWAWRTELRLDKPAYWGQPGYDGSDLPVTGISFWEAEAFAKSVDARLPYESEWQAIATNGWTTRYPWGNVYSADFPANTGFFEGGHSRPLAPVRAYHHGMSKHGVWDLLGNVAEWCLLDQGQEGPLVAVLCGGSRWNPSNVVDACFRDEVYKGTRDNQTGIRLLKGAPDEYMYGDNQVKRSEFKREGIGPSRQILRPTSAFRQEGLPDVGDLAAWRLRVTGEVEVELELTLEQITRKYPQTVMDGLFVCVCRWADVTQATGVLLSDILLTARPKCDKFCVLQSSWPGPSGKRYQSCLSEAVHDFSKVLLCHSLNGALLTRELGWPLRTVCFDVYGYKQVKCVAELRVQSDFQAGWWEQKCCYDPVGRLRSGTACLVGPNARQIEIEDGH